MTLPAGMLVNPSAANGLQACTEQADRLSRPGQRGPALTGLLTGTVRLLDRAGNVPRTVQDRDGPHQDARCSAEELDGGVYLAAQEANPFGSLIAVYLVAENETSGLRVKLAGEGKLNQTTGQITTSLQNTPQVPFEELKLGLFGGPRASLTTPPQCGLYTTTSS